MSACPTPQKKAFATRKEAKANAREVRSKHSSRGRIHAYLCVCGAFHLGSMPRWILEEGRPRPDLRDEVAGA